MRRKLWKIRNLNPEAASLGEKYKISAYVVQLLLNRGIPESDFCAFLNHNLNCLHSALLIPDMEKSAGRIRQALSRGEKILLVGDYDVDGITSLAIFHEFIKEFPDTFSFYIPHRVSEGYGLNKKAIKAAKDELRTLVIAFDCGTNSLEEIEFAKELGIDVIVVDHHFPQQNLNRPFAFINPKRLDSKYPFSDLSSAALSFKLLQILTEKDCFEMLDLVALSLVCDVVPLKGENRILLKEGLSRLRKTKRPAIEAICKTSRLKKENINTHHIGYILGPRINASGRVACARDSLEIFISNDKEKIFDTATKLEEYNLQRRDIEANILKEAQAQLDNNLTDDYAVVVAGDNWHSGVLGIVASRLVEKYYRPSFVISFDDEIGRGSARSIHSVHLMEVLENCAGSLQAYGGHQKAAGIEIFKAGLEDFRQAVNSFIKQNTRPQDLVPVLDIDLRLDFEEINVELLYQLERLEPFGEENPQPLFAASAIFKKSEPKKTPNGYRIWLSGKNTTCEALFYDKDFLEVFAAAEKFDIAYNLGRNNYHNSPVLIIRDLRFAGDKP